MLENYTSYMNNTKWIKVLDILVQNKVEVKTKLVSYDTEGEEVITAYTDKGKPSYLTFEKLYKRSPLFFESEGPFTPSDIEWIELKKNDFEKYILQLGIKLKTENTKETVKIYGYKEGA